MSWRWDSRLTLFRMSIDSGSVLIALLKYLVSRRGSSMTDESKPIVSQSSFILH
jgi:hypothetical protein